MERAGLNPLSGGGVYLITNSVNSKRYVGSSANLYVRYCEHVGSLRDGKHHNVHLQRAWVKYGADAFTFCVLEYISDRSQIIPREQYYIDVLKPEYNMAPSATSCLGIKRSLLTRMRVGAATRARAHKQSVVNINMLKNWWRGKRHTPEHNAKIAAALRGKTRSVEHRQHLSDAMRHSERAKLHRDRLADAKRGQPLMAATEAAAKAKRGKPHSPEHRAHLSAALKGRIISPETRAKISAAKRAKRLTSLGDAPA